MRIAIGGLAHETHTFAATRTTLREFRQRVLCEGEELLTQLGGTRTEPGGMIDGADKAGIRLVPTIFASANPSGLVTAEAFESLATKLLEKLKQEGHVNGVLMPLHGAMVAEGYEDPEGWLIEQVRLLVGSSVPIVVTTDFHGNVSPLMVKKANVIIGYDTYPHLDAYDRGLEAVAIMQGILSGKLVPTMALAKPPLMPAVERMLTDEAPMRDLIDMAHAVERETGVIAVTVAGGFPYADVPFAGMSFVVTTNSDMLGAKTRAQTLARAAWERRHRFLVKHLPVDEGVRRAIAFSSGPVVLVDPSDNVGGGAPGDGTVVLRSLLEHKAKGAVVAIADPEAVEVAIQAGVGNAICLDIGGKTDSLHGAPVAVEGRVRTISDGVFRYKGPYMTGDQINMGRSVVLDCSGVLVLLSELKTMPFDQEQLRCMGIDPVAQKIIVVKSAIAWRAAYEHIAKAVIELDTPGLCTADLSRFEYKRVRRPVFPIDPECIWEQTN